MVIVWTALSYSVPKTIPASVPRRLFSPLPWEASSLQHWTVAKVVTLLHFSVLILASAGADWNLLLGKNLAY